MGEKNASLLFDFATPRNAKGQYEKRLTCKRGHDLTYPNSKASNRQCRICKNSITQSTYRLRKYIRRDKELIQSLQNKLFQIERIIHAEEVGD